jgi:hypothetical protein
MSDKNRRCSTAPKRTTISRHILRYFVLGLLAISISCQAGQPKKEQTQPVEKQTSAISTKTDGTKSPIGSNIKITVYYFHGNVRCPTCYKLENFAKSEVETDFAEAIKNEKLEWKTINVEEKGNEHFADDYKLYTKSVIVSTAQDGKELSWKNLDKIWQLVQDEKSYRNYIAKEVKACFEGKCL